MDGLCAFPLIEQKALDEWGTELLWDTQSFISGGTAMTVDGCYCLAALMAAVRAGTTSKRSPTMP